MCYSLTLNIKNVIYLLLTIISKGGIIFLHLLYFFYISKENITMRTCERCQKPLTDFELTFHQKAQSPQRLSCQCWSCSGAEQDFVKLKIGVLSHCPEIVVSLLGVVFIAALIVIIAPLLSLPSSEVPDFFIQSAAYYIIACSLIPTFVIFIRKKKRKKTYISDPPMERYSYSYGISSTRYITKEKFDGSIVTEKVTDNGTRLVDNWKCNYNSSFSEKIIDFYVGLFSKFVWFLIFIFVGFTFAFWAIPYIITVLVSDIRTSSKQKALPPMLRKAYAESKKKEQQMPITFQDKVKFLVSKENSYKKSANKSKFVSNFTGASPAYKDKPFYYTYKKKTKLSYMIVDYHREENKNYGITFVLIGNRKGVIDRKMITENNFVDSDSNEWALDWKQHGVPYSIISNIVWYENKFTEIIKSKRRKKHSILG